MRFLLWPLSALLAPRLIAAQSDTLRPAASATCWRGKPAPQCQTFWLTEISGEYAFASTTAHYRAVYSSPSGTFVTSYDRPDISSRLVWTVGPMFNTSPRHAVGGTLTAGFVDGGQRIAIEARRRNWFPESGLGLDFSAGALQQSVPFHEGRRAYGLTAGAYVIGEDLINMNVHADV